MKDTTNIKEITAPLLPVSLRDYFAGQALVGITLNEYAYNWGSGGVAERAYKIADAMLKARENSNA